MERLYRKWRIINFCNIPPRYTKKTPPFDDDLFTVPLDRYESYFIPGCMERYRGTAQISNGESGIIREYEDPL